MTVIEQNIKEVLSEINNDQVTLVAVSKTKPVEMIVEAYEAGQRVFGENKVQELVEKQATLAELDIQWHMIGHLQRNKVKYIAPFVDLIHGVDSFRLLSEINKQGAKNERKIPCLLQVHIADEETKFGFSPEELQNLFKGNELDSLENVDIKGVMGMATNTDNQKQIKSEFEGLSSLAKDISQRENSDLQIVSMGMSGDYMIAIESGSTMVRVGSKIFGARNYNNG